MSESQKFGAAEIAFESSNMFTNLGFVSLEVLSSPVSLAA